MKQLIRKFVADECGQDIIEYALLAGFISLASVVTVLDVGTGVGDIYADLETQAEALSN